MPSCREQAVSEDYYDYIYDQNLFPTQKDDLCRIDAGFGTGVYFRPKSDGFAYENYYALPKLFGLADATAVEAAGALRARLPDGLGLTGAGCLIGLIDTGIQYSHEVFLDDQGRSRVVGIWDQTAGEAAADETFFDGTDSGDLPPAAEGADHDTLPAFRGIPYGIAYTHAEILAGTARGQDENGHGTFLASLAAGRAIPSEGFSGIAPESRIAMVKLKPAKRYLRELFLVKDSAVAYEESDILLGARYLLELAEELQMPLVILLGLESSNGSHTGSLALDDFLSRAAARSGVAVVCAVGNEGDKQHHYYGSFSAGEEYLEAEIRVAEPQAASDAGFTLELWGAPPDIYRIAVISPGGEIMPPAPAGIRQNLSYSFLLNSAIVEVGFRLLEFLSGDQLIFLRFRDPVPGVWRIRIYDQNLLYGSVHMWLPIEAFLSEDVSFLSPDPDTTVTAPGNSAAILTFSGYDARTGSFYPASGRGFTAKGQISPALAAPAVNVLGARIVPDGYERAAKNVSSIFAADAPAVNSSEPPIHAEPDRSEIARFERRSGTSLAAAIGAGACALMLEWGIRKGRLPGMRTVEIRNILIRGAGRSQSLTYPNREFGYGTLNVENSFLVLTDRIFR